MHWLRAARLFDGERLIDVPTVLLDEGRVVASGVTPPESATVHELGDATLLPGLVDCHQHLCFDGHGTLQEQVTGVDDESLEQRARSGAERALRAGVTTLRDLGDRGYVSLKLRGDRNLPAILASGPPITRVNGHCWFLGGEVEGDDQLRRGVEARAERGCDVVKVMVSGGVLTPTFPMWQSQFTAEEVRLVVDTARAHGLPVAAHCHGVDAIAAAVDAGVDSIEHCTFFTESGSCEPPDELLRRIADSGTAVSTSLGRLADQPLPPLLAANLDAINGAFSRLHELGATLVVGTDAGIAPGKPHDVLPYAFPELFGIGMTAAQALAAVTSVAAEVVGAGRQKGRIAAGMDADLLAVAGDPLSQPLPLTDVLGVWRAGVPVR